jgi:hypothetical protein
MRRLLPLLFLLTGCTTGIQRDAGPIPSVALGQQFLLGQDVPVSLADTGYLLSFEKVLEDSRCPLGVSCIWEGNARVVVHFIADRDEFSLELNTSARFATSATRGAFRVELRQLDPTPRADAPTTGYVATLVVSKS